MRNSCPRTATASSRVAARLSALLLLTLGNASACATEENTLPDDAGDIAAGNDSEPTSGSGGSGGAPSGGTPSTGGTPSSAGTMAGGGGKVGGAFGGTASTGGSGGTGTGGSAGSGVAGSGGKAGAGGTTGASGNGGAGGTAGSSGSGGKAGAGGTGSNLACLNDWKSDPCDTCTTQTQGDKLACVDILDCFAANACGPSTCANNDDKCGANKIGKGTAGYPIAAQVYDCLCQ